jgi:hypothetical protein
MSRDINIIILNQHYGENADIESIMMGGEQSNYHTIDDFNSLLVQYGFFKSKSDVRKNFKTQPRAWYSGEQYIHTGIVPSGFTQFRIGKNKRLLTIWNPIARYPE